MGMFLFKTGVKNGWLGNNGSPGLVEILETSLYNLKLEELKAFSGGFGVFFLKGIPKPKEHQALMIKHQRKVRLSEVCVVFFRKKSVAKKQKKTKDQTETALDIGRIPPGVMIAQQ